MALGTGTLPAQVETATPDELIAQYRALDPAARIRVSTEVGSTLGSSTDPVVRRIAAFAESMGDPAKLPLIPEPVAHDPKRWAPGAAPERTVLQVGDPKHTAVAGNITPHAIAPDLRKAVVFHWGSGQIARVPDHPARADDLVENALHGYAPHTDRALALMLDGLSTSPHERNMGKYLGHLYANLDADVFAGLTLFDAWDSVGVVSVPDVDSIPFAREILKIGTFRSPIPGGARRAWLFEQIRDATSAHRRYRALREAVALTWVAPKPTLDTQFSTLADRFHAMYGLAKGVPKTVLERMGIIGSRGALAAVFDEVQSNAGAPAATRAELAAFAAMRLTLLEAVTAALTAEAAR